MPEFLVQGNAKHIPLHRDSVQCVVTSPPYWGLRTYGDDNEEIGREDLSSYLDIILDIFNDIKSNYLKDDGTIWINIGDTYSGSGGSGGDFNSGGGHSGKAGFRQGNAGIIPKRSLCVIPHEFIVKFVEAGWILRRDIIWDKGIVKPENPFHTKRPGMQHEYILFFSKNTKYKYHAQWHIGADAERGDIWHIAPSRGTKKSPAPMPEELARRCIELSTDEGDIVFDPFAGGNTTAKVASQMGRIGVGLELYGGKFI